MKKYFCICVLFFLCLNLSLKAQILSDENLPLPSAAQLEWQKKECAMFVHFGPAAFQGREYDNWSSDITKMTLKNLDTDQWCKVARSWGARMIVFVAKHCGGFCWWPTMTTEYGVRQIPWKNGKGDLMRELAISCKKHGLDLGVYLYPGDEHWGAGIGSGGKTSDQSKQEAYNRVYRKQLEELLSQYGAIKEVWFDGSCHIPVKDILERYAADAVYFQGRDATLRWVGNEDGFAPDPNWYTIQKKDMLTGTSTALHSDVNGDVYAPVEVDVPFLKNGGHKWFWAPHTDSLLMTREQLMNIYCNSVGRGSVLLLNSSPDTTGAIPASHVKVYDDFGKTIRRYFGKPIKRTASDAVMTYLTLKKPTRLNHLIIREDLSKGQRILDYQVEGRSKNGPWSVIVKGTSVGNKKIDWFEDGVWNELRLSVLKSKGIPHITDFSVYYVPDRLYQKKDSYADFVKIGYWESNTFPIDHEQELELDLTPYVNAIGQYEIVFRTLGYDYSDNRPSGLELSEVNLNMYGHQMNEALEFKPQGNVIRITRSQQTLDDYCTRLKMKVRSRPCKTYGEIVIRKCSY